MKRVLVVLFALLMIAIAILLGINPIKIAYSGECTPYGCYIFPLPVNNLPQQQYVNQEREQLRQQENQDDLDQIANQQRLMLQLQQQQEYQRQRLLRQKQWEQDLKNMGVPSYLIPPCPEE